MVLLRWISSWLLISKRNIQVHQKDTLDLAIPFSCLKALNDRGCLRLNQVLSREFKVKSQQPSTCLRGMLSLANGPQTWQEFDMTNQRQTWPVHWLSQSRTNGRYNAFEAPSGTELNNETNQDSKSPMFFLTAVTRNLAIVGFLCEYSGPFWGMFSKIRLDIYNKKYFICAKCVLKSPFLNLV